MTTVFDRIGKGPNLNIKKKRGGHFATFTGPCSYVDTGHIYLYIMMKCCMVACINNIQYAENWSVEAAAEDR